MKKEKGKMSAEGKAAIAVEIVTILEKEAGGHELEILHTVASLLGVSIKIDLI